jgi:uncharacterized protein (DUF2147 family)
MRDHATPLRTYLRFPDFPSRRRAHCILGLCIGTDGSQVESRACFITILPVGRWKTVDDATGKVKSIVAIREENGKLFGTIEELFDPPVPHPTCYLCTGDLKDRPLVGLRILWDFAPDGGQWSGGQVLDPETGKIYRASMALEDGGKKLRLHGYFLVTLLGRTEHWLRAE